MERRLQQRGCAGQQQRHWGETCPIAAAVGMHVHGSSPANFVMQPALVICSQHVIAQVAIDYLRDAILMRAGR